MSPQIIDMAQLSPGQRDEAAALLSRALDWTEYADPSAAAEEVAKTIADEDREGLAAVAGGAVLGWIGMVRSYSHAFELHPLAVDPPHQGRGVGAALVAALEARARAAGAITLYLGTDDETDGTNLSGRELFPNVLAAAAQIAPTNGHPFTFYLRQGYEVVGLVPHANGFGRPDILMAKRIG